MGGDVPPALMPGAAHWSHRSEPGAAPEEVNREETTSEEFLQQDRILPPCCVSQVGSIGLCYPCVVVTPRSLSLMQPLLKRIFSAMSDTDPRCA